MNDRSHATTPTSPRRVEPPPPTNPKSGAGGHTPGGPQPQISDLGSGLGSGGLTRRSLDRMVEALDCGVCWWSWRESNPRPSGGNPTRYDRSRGCGLRLPPRRVERARGPSAGSFSDVSGLCRLSVVSPYCPPPLLVPGCDGQAPRAIAGRDDSLLTDLDQAARARSSVLASLLVPRFGSLSNSGRTP